MRNKVSRVTGIEKEVLLAAKTEKVEMTLNTENAIASGLLIQRLTELYENPIEATVRETVSNAIDAVTQSHSGERPVVKIFSPSSLHPVLVIEDNGIGMTYDELKEIYAKYGSSTKVNNLETIGAYGLGAKSPLAYGTEFTVTSIKNRQKTTIIVAREELTNYIKIVSSIETDEPSGTKVSIPVNSKDIEEFNEHINQYNTNPMDKDIDLIINNQLIKNELIAIADDVKIYEGKDEVVYGKIWVDPKRTIQLLDIGKYGFNRHARFVIGGWAYQVPASKRNYYGNGSDARIYVELKPGIVGFNSSRDAILDNDRYEDLDKLVTDYIFSARFTDDIINAANELPLDEFKKLISWLLYSYRSYMTFDNNKISMDAVRFDSRIVNMNKLKHKETGFSVSSIVEDVPATTEPTVVFKESKSSYYQTAKNSLMESEPTSYSQFNQSSVTSINREIDEVMAGIGKSHSLALTMVYLTSILHNSDEEKLSGMKFTFVTDINNEDLRKLKSGRKSLIKIRNGQDDLQSYTSLLIYTKHKKEDIETMVENTFPEDIDVYVDTVDEVLEAIETYKSEKRAKRKSTPKKEGLSTAFYKLTPNGRAYPELKDIENVENSLVIITKDSAPYSRHIELIRTWYANQKDITNDEVQLYLSMGNHNIADLEALQQVFGSEIYRDPESDNVGISKMYYENFHDKVAGKNAISNKLVNTSEKAFLRLIMGVYESNVPHIVDRLLDKTEYINEIAKEASIEFDFDTYEAKLKEIRNFDTSIYGDVGYRSSCALEEHSIKHLLSKIDQEHIDLAQDILTILDSENFSIDGDKVNVYYSRNIDVLPTRSLVEEIYRETKVYSDNYIKLVKLAVEGYLEFTKTAYNQLLLMNFQ